MKVLHITNWYPNEWNTYEGVFIKEQFDVFKTITDTQLVNVQIRRGSSIFKFRHLRYNGKEEAYLIFTSLDKWKIVELLSTLLLLFVLYKKKVNKFDILQIHIAYPLMRFYGWWKKFIKIPILISEHWSAYHLNFNLPPGNRSLDKIRSIFRHRLPVITVSKALQNDIAAFALRNDIKFYYLPNIIDTDAFNLNRQKDNIQRENSSVNFFIVNV